ncbi:hypothetical protein FQJ88_13490 [Xanthomonas vasicola]|uniref:Uncharacterized protein n=1 Tax=Xanthomonas vasicola TaxID=56459 RepID=A0ABD7S955_XANVA|nr:hypothetical protein NX81_000100 [Xanthomonas vasicola]TWQ26377.1 hypothetical protein FQJ97_00105 [Xanthomonas vasicola]TWQ38076.1 hypothetical protein FQJ96_12795 [Xanthomonas vasicola]TWQ51785.1 hypothetical protein FQK01_14520 [Xanthomonas vasicola]TWQ56614.1 hypothetical protein FQJ94_08410 [Xanthomonas vasicola]
MHGAQAGSARDVVDITNAWPRGDTAQGGEARCLARFAGCWLRVLGVQRSKEKPRRSGVFRQTTQAATIRTCS